MGFQRLSSGIHSIANAVEYQCEDHNGKDPAAELGEFAKLVLMENKRPTLHVDAKSINCPILGDIRGLALEGESSSEDGSCASASQHVEQVLHGHPLDLLIRGGVHIQGNLVALAHRVIEGVLLEVVKALGWNNALDATAVDRQDVIRSPFDRL